MKSELKTGMGKRLIPLAGTFALQAAALLMASGKTDWGAAWVYLGASLTGVAINIFILLGHRPETIVGRAKTEEEKRDWKSLAGGLFILFYFLALPLVAGLDERFGWTGSLDSRFHLDAIVVFLVGFALFSWALTSNPFFSAVVRIELERGHKIISGGPYRFVRHPGYTGILIQSITIPLVLESFWAYIPAALSAAFLIALTALEDRTLKQELEGYKEYVTRTPYRIFPGIW